MIGGASGASSTTGVALMGPPGAVSGGASGTILMGPPGAVGGAGGMDISHSRGSDAGSIKDTASDTGSNAGSTATMDTSMSANTSQSLASAASTAFFPPQVHFFSLDDFAGHEIHAILEDGEAEDPEVADPARRDEAGSQDHSVRPGSIISNLEQRLDEIEGFHGEPQPDHHHPEGATAPSSSAEAGSSMSAATGRGYDPADALQSMQYRELTPADLVMIQQMQSTSTHGAGPSSASTSRHAGAGSSSGWGASTSQATSARTAARVHSPMPPQPPSDPMQE